jgi:ribose 5-phosphate isomerase B
VVGPELANILVDHWLGVEFQGGRSARKVEKIDALDRLRSARAQNAGTIE